MYPRPQFGICLQGQGEDFGVEHETLLGYNLVDDDDDEDDDDNHDDGDDDHDDSNC